MTRSPNSQVRGSAGFTLIELLVVIAIIAILAAILFPVFAQAKAAAKKTASLSNLKNLGTAANIYSADHDDLFPITYAPEDPASGASEYSWGRFIATPASYVQATFGPARMNVVNSFVYNNILPYTKNEQIFSDPVGQKLTVNVYYSPTPPAGANLVAKSYSYNGLLNGYSGSATGNPSTVPLFWTAGGKRATIGSGNVSPDLICRFPSQPCVYTPTSFPAASCGPNNTNGIQSSVYTTSGGFGWDMHTQSQIFAFTDSSAKSRKSGVYSSGNTDPRRDPFAFWNGTQVPVRRWWTSAGGTACHAYLFRPDIDINSNNDPAVGL